MKRFQVVFSLLVFLGIALAFALQRPADPEEDAASFEPPRPVALPPVRGHTGALELTGRVETSAGTPVAGVLVTLFPDDPDDDGGSEPPAPAAKSSSEPLSWTHTDEQGAFVLRRLAPGAYRGILAVESAPPTVVRAELPASEPVVWRLAAPLPPLPHLPALQRGPLEVRLRSDGATELGDASLEGFELVLRPDTDVAPLAGASVRRTTSSADGSFTLADVVLARYRLEILPPWARGGSWPVVAGTVRDVDSTTANAFELALAVGSLAGELVEASGQPLEGALVRLDFLDALDAAGAPQAWPPEVTDARGRFAFWPLPPGRYRLHLSAGLCSRAVDVTAVAGELTHVPLAPLDPRAAE